MLAGDPHLANQPISTTAVYGQVTLTGRVRDEASRDMAEKLAADVPGVKKVIDELTVGSTSDSTSVAESGSAQEQGSVSAGDQPVLQSDGTCAPAQTAQDRSQMGSNDGGGNASGISRTEPEGSSQGQRDEAHRPPYNPGDGPPSQAYGLSDGT